MSHYGDKSNKKRNMTVGIGALLVFVCIFVGIFTYLILEVSTDKVYAGVTIGSLDLGGKTKAEVVSLLSETYPADDINVKLDCDGTVFDLYGSSFGLKIDYEATAEEAMSYGKDGFLFKKISNMLKTKGKSAQIKLAISCDYNVLQYTINENLGDKIKDVQNYSVEIGEDELIVSNGKPGRTVPAQKVIDSISEAIMSGNISNVIKLSIEEVYPEPINAEAFIEEYNRKAQDATVEEDGDEIKIIPEVIGIKLDAEKTKKILAENKDSEEKYSIPAVITYPDVTATELEAEYTDTLLASYYTDYSTSSANRKTNIALASSKIDGLILNPGQVFSFNEVVGPRTEATGYKVAHVYSGSKVVDGIGGGICQVSSTLYNAVVLADLEIVYRTNHSLPVSYVPLGRDATVSYGSIDFKFKNSKESPIKFEVIANGTNLIVNVYGRKQYIKDISIETTVTGSVPCSTETIEDPTLPKGETVVVEAGSNGTKVEAYKVVKENGVVVSRTLLARSTYSPTTKVVRVGTAETEEEPKEEPEEEQPKDPTGEVEDKPEQTTDDELPGDVTDVTIPENPDIPEDAPDITKPSVPDMPVSNNDTDIPSTTSPAPDPGTGIQPVPEPVPGDEPADAVIPQEPESTQISTVVDVD